jgi:hypothetical protein
MLFALPRTILQHLTCNLVTLDLSISKFPRTLIASTDGADGEAHSDPPATSLPETGIFEPRQKPFPDL